MSTQNTLSNSGLSSSAARSRLLAEGYNELPSKKKRRPFLIFWEIIREPMLILLLAAGAIYFILGEKSDAIILSTFIFASIFITFYQRRKTERALEALKELSSPRAMVIRDGIHIKIPSREIVLDDILILQEGDRVSADCAIVENNNLIFDESLLTGESLGVSKIIWDGQTNPQNFRPGGQNLPIAYSGTLITRGHGLARVVATGPHTEIGKIGQSLSQIQEEHGPLKKEISRLVKIFGLFGLTLCIAVVLFYWFISKNWLESLLYGITVGMSVLPEEFPVVVLIFLTLGAWLLSRKKVLTRDPAVIETLGSAQILCVDKTGTLTENRMRLQALLTDGNLLEISDGHSNFSLLPEHRELLRFSFLASPKDPFDPLEKEIHRSAKIWLPDNSVYPDWKIIKEYPFSKNLMAVAYAWELPKQNQYIVSVKGAPETILELCHLPVEKSEELLSRLKPLMNQGLRLLGVAQATISRSSLSNNLRDYNFQFVGFLGFSDPIRPSVPKAIAECYRAGIRVCMITGDFPGTAQAIASKIGLKNPENFLTGEDLQNLSVPELKKRLSNTNIFARVVPEQKMLIINALKNNGDIIAMTGDGVNDAPALKSANIGIAMGERGTDVAREAADLVLLNDDFKSIVQGISTGRSIFDNLKKALSYITAIHVPIAGMAFLPVILNLPIVFYPIHIAFLEMIIDPSCSLIFEAEKPEKNIMSRPPRNLKKPLFSRFDFLNSLFQGLGVLVIVFAVFIFSLSMGKNQEETRAITFFTLVLLNLMLIVANLSTSKNFLQILAGKNKMLILIIVAVIFAAALIIFIPFLRQVFHFTLFNSFDFVSILSAAILGIFWLEGLKWFIAKLFNHRSK